MEIAIIIGLVAYNLVITAAAFWLSARQQANYIEYCNRVRIDWLSLVNNRDIRGQQ